MTSNWPATGLFVTGTGTEVGKTIVACMIARSLCHAGHKVGVYKPAASGCRRSDPDCVSDAELLWKAAGQPKDLASVCPQTYEAPLAPHLAARVEGRELDSRLLREGLSVWRDSCDIVLVEGAGGLFSPLGEHEYNADLALEFGYPLIVVAANRLGVINDTVQTLIAASSFQGGLGVGGVVLNNPLTAGDASKNTNRSELEFRCSAPLLTEVGHGATQFDDQIPWFDLARS